MTNSLTHEPGQPHQGWVFKAGKWIRAEDPVMNRPEGEIDDAIKAAGYRSWTGAGKGAREFDLGPLMLTVYARSEQPSFLFDLEGPEHSEWVYAETLPDALALLTQLAPTLQALTLTDQIARAEPKTESVLADILDKLHDRHRDQGGRIISG
ncbi:MULTISPECIES: hypothetical protein [Streptomyces]|uniref:hypothetical protein n=1 Tax=Streptomyces TaxID=1883 RepID=UPI003461745B